jgi:hypothetical protein
VAVAWGGKSNRLHMLLLLLQAPLPPAFKLSDAVNAAHTASQQSKQAKAAKTAALATQGSAGNHATGKAGSLTTQATPASGTTGTQQQLPEFPNAAHLLPAHFQRTILQGECPLQNGSLAHRKLHIEIYFTTDLCCSYLNRRWINPDNLGHPWSSIDRSQRSKQAVQRSC